MKKYIYLAMLLIAGTVMCSCDNDEIEIEKISNGSKQINVNLATIVRPFENVDMNDELSKLSDGNYLKTCLLIFDKETEELVSKEYGKTSSYNESLTFSTDKSLKRGDYRVIAVTYIANDKADYWTIRNENKLSELAVQSSFPKDRLPLHENMLGLGSTDIAVGRQDDESVNIDVNPAGAVIKVQYENYKKQWKYNDERILEWFLFSKQANSLVKYDGVNISSDYESFDNWEIYWSQLVPFDYPNDPYELQYQWVFIPVMDKFNVCFGPMTSSVNMYPLEPGYTFTDIKAGDYYYAVLSEGKTQKYGKGIYQWEGGKSSKFYKDPYLNWDGTVSDVQSYMSDFNLYNNIQYDGTDYSVTYQGYDQTTSGGYDEVYYKYYFTTKTTGLNAVLVTWNKSNFTIDYIKNKLLSNGYIFAKEDSGKILYLSDNTTVLVTEDENNYIVFYSPRINLLYKEPYLTWGGTVSDVKSYMSAYYLYSDIQQYGTDYYITYQGYDNTNEKCYYEYYFSEKTTGLNMVLVYLDKNSNSISEIGDYLQSSGYAYLMEDSGRLYYQSDNANAVIVEGNYYVIYYIPRINSVSIRKIVQNENQNISRHRHRPQP